MEIGLQNLYYAIINSDTIAGISYQAPKHVPGLNKMNIAVQTSDGTYYADNGPHETIRMFKQVDVGIELADLDMDTQADWFGNQLIGGQLIEKSTDNAPYVAIGFEATKSNGNSRFTWLLKGRFSPPDTNSETTGDSVKFNAPTVKGTFIRRAYDNQWRRKADEDHPDYLPIVGANWFTAVDNADTTLPNISSSVPAAGASGVAANSTIVWNFSEPLMLSTINNTTFIVIKDTDGSAVPGALTVNAARTQVTFTPESNLSATTAYRTIVTKGVRDLFGNYLASSDVRKFTTA